MKSHFKIVFGASLFFQTVLCAMEGLNIEPAFYCGIWQHLGNRRFQEDKFCADVGWKNVPGVAAEGLFGVFDGHSLDEGMGDHVSRWASIEVPRIFLQSRTKGQDVRSAMTYALAQIEERSKPESEYPFSPEVGSTVALMGIDEQGIAHVATDGDSPVILFDKTKDGLVKRCRTQDHIPCRRDEAERVFKQGGVVGYVVKNSNEDRLNIFKEVRAWQDLPQDFASHPEKYDFYVHGKSGNMSQTTRSLGDAAEKDILSADPEFLDPQKFDENSLALLISDGVTDAFNDDEIASHLSKLMAKRDSDLAATRSIYFGQTYGNNEKLKNVVRLFGDQVLNKERFDNVTIMLIQKAQE
jgi:serine/threonine protein phosphatase PrpC